MTALYAGIEAGDGRLMHGLVHPEMGHVRVPRDARASRAARGASAIHGAPPTSRSRRSR